MSSEYTELRAMFLRIAEMALDDGCMWLALGACIEKMKYKEIANDG